MLVCSLWALPKNKAEFAERALQKRVLPKGGLNVQESTKQNLHCDVKYCGVRIGCCNNLQGNATHCTALHCTTLSSGQICIYIDIDTYRYTSINIHIYMHSYTHVNIHTNTHTYAHTHRHTHKKTHAQTSKYITIHTHKARMHTHTHSLSLTHTQKLTLNHQQN